MLTRAHLTEALTLTLASFGRANRFEFQLFSHYASCWSGNVAHTHSNTERLISIANSPSLPRKLLTTRAGSGMAGARLVETLTFSLAQFRRTLPCSRHASLGEWGRRGQLITYAN